MSLARGVVSTLGIAEAPSIFVLAKEHTKGESCSEYGLCTATVNAKIVLCEALSLPSTEGGGREDPSYKHTLPADESHKGNTVSYTLEPDKMPSSVHSLRGKHGSHGDRWVKSAAKPPEVTLAENKEKKRLKLKIH